MAQQAASSIGEAVSLSQALPARVAQALMAAAKTAFIQAHSLVLATAGVLLLLAAEDLAQPRHRGETAVGAIAAATDPSPRAAGGARAFSFNAAALTVAAGTPDIQGGHHLTVTRQHGYRQRAQAYLDLPVGEGIALHAHPGDLCT